MKVIAALGIGASLMMGRPLSREKKSSTMSKGVSLKLNEMSLGFSGCGAAGGTGGGTG
jgi:hypothetical protein